jgi:hypothetical protein
MCRKEKGRKEMNTILKKLSSIAFAALILLSIMPLISAVPPPDNIAMWIEPATIDPIALGLGLHDTFEVTVWAKANVDIKGWQFWLDYNSTMLNATACAYSAGSTSDYFLGLSTFPVAPSFTVVDSTTNRVAFGESGGIGIVAPPNTAALAVLTFEIMDVPEKGGNLISEINISDAANSTVDKTYLIDGVDTNVHYYTAYDTTYSYVWTTPPGPVLTFDPPTRDFDKFTDWNGFIFTEDIVLEDLDALWGLTNTSLTFTYDNTELEITDIIMNTADWDLTAFVDNTTTPGQVDIFVETSLSLGGDILIATISFRIIDQGLFPAPDDIVALAFTDVAIFDHILEIDPSAVIDGQIIIRSFQSFENPWMEVVPEDTVVGDGEFVKCTTFQIEVTINRLHYAAQLVGFEFRLGYDDTLVEVVDVEEGPYLGGWAPFGTFFVSFIEPNFYGPHVLVGGLILPNGTGHWNPPFPGADAGNPGENGTIAIITFHIIEQLPEPDFLTGTFDLFEIQMVDVNAEELEVALDSVVNGTYTCLGFPWQGRYIDVYGGADNAGYGSIPFPAPFGGQGLGNPMDLVIPQSEVTLFVDVMYNYWPVQSKEVNFEVEGPYLHLFNETSQEWYYEPMQTWFILLKETAVSDTDGIATISFAMPWPCENPWGTLLGVYKVTATVNIRDTVVIDTMYFYYDYLVHIFDVTTGGGLYDEGFYFKHDECVKITIDYGSHSMQTYPALFSAMIKDELNVVIGIDLLETTVGGAEFCTFANGTIELEICIPKWAFVGYADLYVNVYDKDPTEGGFAWGQQFFIDDAIYILPN